MEPESYRDIELYVLAHLREVLIRSGLASRSEQVERDRCRLEAVLPKPARPNIRQILDAPPIRSNAMTRNFQLLYGGRLGRRGCMPKSLSQLEAQHAQLQAVVLRWQQLAVNWATERGIELDDPTPEDFFTQLEQKEYDDGLERLASADRRDD